MLVWDGRATPVRAGDLRLMPVLETRTFSGHEDDVVSCSPVVKLCWLSCILLTRGEDDCLAEYYSHSDLVSSHV